MSMGTKNIRINSSVTDRVSHYTLKIIQGDLKELRQADYLKFKKSILKDGFIDPIDVWENESGELSVVGGTQRTRMLSALENEGYQIPLIPVNRIKAGSLKEACEIVLTLASQYGKITNQGLLEFATCAGFSDLKEIEDSFSLPEIKFDKIADEFTKDHTDKKPRKCPRCGEQI